MISGKEIGVTTLLVWGADGQPKLYSVEVTADAAGLERYLKEVLPNQDVTVSASGNTVTLSGQVRDPSAAARAVEIVKGSGAVVIDNLSMPTALQVQVKVWFAEANRNALEEWSSRLSTVNPHELSDDGRWAGSTVVRRDHRLLADQWRLVVHRRTARVEGSRRLQEPGRADPADAAREGSVLPGRR